MRHPVTASFLAVFVIAAFMLGATPAYAGDLEDADAAHARGDYATSLKLLRPLAEKGGANAQYNLGVSYFKGEGVPKDLKEAEKWFRLAAAQGHAGAQYSLGAMYLVKNDYKEALKWAQLSAEQGNAPSQVNLAIMYYEGQGVARDYVRAHMWMSLAALQRAPNAVNYRDEMAKKLTAAQLVESQKLVKEWQPK